MKDKRKAAVRVRAGSLAKALGDVAGIVPARATVPVLEHVLISVGDGAISISGTDLDSVAERVLASDDKGQPDSREWCAGIRAFRVTLPARKLADVVKRFDKDAMVVIEADADINDAWGGRVTVKAGRARFQLNALPVCDLPIMPTDGHDMEFTIKASALADALASVDYAMSHEETRYYLNGVFCHVAQAAGEPQWFCFAATDGHRLARKRIEVPDGAAAWPDMILPRRMVGHLAKLLGEADKTSEGAEVVVSATSGGTRVQFEMPCADDGSVRLLTKTVDGTFPDYGRVIPTMNDKSAVVPREGLIDAVDRMAVMATKESKAVKAEFSKGILALSIQNAELGEGREEVPIDYEGEPITIAFNGDYWRDVLRASGADNVRMVMADPGAPTLVVSDALARESDHQPYQISHVQVLMPMRV